MLRVHCEVSRDTVERTIPRFSASHLHYCFGDQSVRETPGPIPNPEVKPDSADGTARGTVWETRTSPDYTTPQGRPFVVDPEVFPRPDTFRCTRSTSLPARQLTSLQIPVEGHSAGARPTSRASPGRPLLCMIAAGLTRAAFRVVRCADAQSEDTGRGQDRTKKSKTKAQDVQKAARYLAAFCTFRGRSRSEPSWLSSCVEDQRPKDGTSKC